jgi:hypothetical protein
MSCTRCRPERKANWLSDAIFCFRLRSHQLTSKHRDYHGRRSKTDKRFASKELMLLIYSSFTEITSRRWALLWSRQLCSYSRTFQHFMEPEDSLPCSQKPSRASARSKESVQVRSPLWHFVTRLFYGEELLAPRPTPSWRTIPCLLTTYSIYSQLPSISTASVV